MNNPKIGEVRIVTSDTIQQILPMEAGDKFVVECIYGYIFRSVSIVTLDGRRFTWPLLDVLARTEPI